MPITQELNNATKKLEAVGFPHKDLGGRLEDAFCKAFEIGFKTVLAVGTVCPGLTAEKIRKAIEQLSRSDVAIIPSLIEVTC